MHMYVQQQWEHQDVKQELSSVAAFLPVFQSI